MFTETQWDHEVDIVCIGAEGGVLAAGLVAANADLDVYLGISESAGGGDLAATLSYRGGDGPTTKHLAGFDYAFGRAGRAHSFWPVRAVEDTVPPRPHRRAAVEPFFGAALEQWAHRCAAAASGLVYNRVTKRQMTQMRSCARGDKVEVAVVGSVELSPNLPALSLREWLRSEASDQGLRPETEVRLLKLIFEDDGVAGALIETPDRVLAVRARENLVVGTRDFPMERAHPLVSATSPVTANVCLVSKAASRFGELEIVTAPGDDNRVVFVDTPEAQLQLASGL
ncbi:hypothetical protein [Mycolicibacterium stellerae]|uniref:hypothetical protein n=1 Tax=Mycolicibacterium stellerae TaxID=2358193 RepID=UPI000F0B1EAD|nr:hypothetical protein [Mycolicibacterium stellerae]